MSTPPASALMATPTAAVPHLIDIGSNLGDPIFRGNYHGKQAHPDDFVDILARARAAGIHTQVLTGDCIPGARDTLALASEHEGLYSTVGCHPCRAGEWEEAEGRGEDYLRGLEELIVAGGEKVVAVGECGLDYARLNHASKETQLKYFPPQLHLATKHNLPLFLHSRDAHSDLVRILREHPTPEGKPLRGVVHSFDGTWEEAEELLGMGFMVGVNGCSLRTAESLEVVKRIPLESLLVESDCPWCELRPSHASSPLLGTLAKDSAYAHLAEVYQPASAKKEKWKEGKAVKGRNEPFATGQVAWVVAQLKRVPIEEVAEVTTRNAVQLFGLPE